MQLNLNLMKGQVLPVTLGLALLASVSIFMVLNSHRAVDEKINLVNAADAAAYSGAQMAARELNFMALTNRAMIANEVAIGHMMAYQTELDVLADALKNGVGGLIGNIISGLIDLVGGDAIIDNFNEINRIWSGAYILAVNATNATYQDFQEDDYRALAGLERDSLLDAVMTTVVKQYQISPAVSIEVNSEDAVAQFLATGDEDLQAVAEAANTNPFCSLIVFAEPSANGASLFDGGAVNRFRGLTNQCENYYRSGNVPNAVGSLGNPVADGGVLVSLLNESARRASSADWVMQRNADYRILGVRIEREGASEAVWDNGQINWKTVGDDTIDTRGLLSLLLSFHGSAAGDARDIADAASNRIGGAVVALLRVAGLCEEIDCDALQDSSYTGIQRYAILNPLLASNTPMVTAVLLQKGNCNDEIGRSDDGVLNPEWNNELPMFEDGLSCTNERNVLAYAQAKVYYQRPACVDAGCTTGFDSNGVSGEQPNLFNPFWQAKLSASSN